MMNEIEDFNRTLFLQINGGDGTPAWETSEATVRYSLIAVQRN